ncbi:MAG: stage II sporulation protein P [Clostridia bacterium]|nr:stage II sporulation protein P [Clostridia bacterium]
MKKTSVATINLRRFRPLFLSLVFSFVIMASIVLSKSLPAITLTEDILRIFLSSNISFDNDSFLVSGAFSLHEKIPGKVMTGAVPMQGDISHIKTPVKAPPKTVLNPEVKISDTTSSGLTAENFLSPAPDFLFEDFSVLIVHTHTTESYTSSPKFSYIPSDTDRTTDKNFNMVRVGEEIKNVLESNGIKVYHDTSINDYPSYSGSYNKSAKAIEKNIKKDPSVKIVLDVHRDAIEGKNGEKIKHLTKIDGSDAAKIMLVVGSNQSGLTHDNWEENMRFAVQLQKHTMSLYPDLCRPINFRSQRFNQQLAPGGIIVEVGTNGNTLDEAILGARCFAVSLSDFIKNSKK